MQASITFAPRRETLFWIAVAVGAFPLALLLARAGFAVPVREPMLQLPMLMLLAIAEELVFRAGLQDLLSRSTWRPMRHRFFALSAPNLLTSAVFGAAHLLAHAPAHALAVVPVSLLLGLAYERSRSLALPIALHIGFNLALYLASAIAS